MYGRRQPKGQTATKKRVGERVAFSDTQSRDVCCRSIGIFIMFPARCNQLVFCVNKESASKKSRILLTANKYWMNVTRTANGSFVSRLEYSNQTDLCFASFTSSCHTTTSHSVLHEALSILFRSRFRLYYTNTRVLLALFPLRLVFHFCLARRVCL